MTSAGKEGKERKARCAGSVGDVPSSERPVPRRRDEVEPRRAKTPCGVLVQEPAEREGGPGGEGGGEIISAGKE